MGFGQSTCNQIALEPHPHPNLPLDGEGVLLTHSLTTRPNPQNYPATLASESQAVPAAIQRFTRLANQPCHAIGSKRT